LTLPVGQALPEQSVELPDRALAQRPPLLDDDAAAGLALDRADGRERTAEVIDQPVARRPAQIDRQFGERHSLTLGIGGVAYGDRFSEVRLVLDPVEVQAKARQHFRVESPLIEEREQRGQDLAGAGLTGLRQEVEVDDHGVQIPRVTRLVILCYAAVTVALIVARSRARTRA